MKTMPTKEYLNDCFFYDAENGSLIWKERPISHFKSEVGMKRVNGKMAGLMAQSSLNGRYYIASINSKFYLCHRIVWCMHYGY